MTDKEIIERLAKERDAYRKVLCEIDVKPELLGYWPGMNIDEGRDMTVADRADYERIKGIMRRTQQVLYEMARQEI